MNSEEIVINPKFSEKVGAIFEKKKRTVDWPKSDDLLAGCENLYQKHKGEFRDRLLEEFYVPEDDILESVERVYWGTVYVLEKMRQLSPIKLGLPIKITPDWTDEPMDRIVTDTEYKGEILKSPIKSVVFRISILPIVMDVLADKKKEHDFYFDYLIDTSFGVEEATKLEKDKHTTERYASSLGSAVHEWAHGLYFVYAFNKKIEKKRIEILRNAVNRMAVDLGQIDQAEYMRQYYDLGPEKSARVWERDFLKTDFPDSKRLIEVQEELGNLGNLNS